MEMTIDESIKRLQALLKCVQLSDEQKKAISNGIKALEKQIAKEVICTPWEYDNRFNIYECPSCGSTGGCQTSDGEALNFCNDCGQRLEW